MTHLPSTSGTVQKDKQNFSKEEFKTQAHFSVIKGKVSISSSSSPLVLFEFKGTLALGGCGMALEMNVAGEEGLGQRHLQQKGQFEHSPRLVYLVKQQGLRSKKVFRAVVGDDWAPVTDEGFSSLSRAMETVIAGVNG